MGKLPPLVRPGIILLGFVLPLFSCAQLQVDLSQNPQSIVQNSLLGEGVELINVSFNGNSGTLFNPQIGTFSSGWEPIGISNGVILATGRATVAEGPNDLPTAFEDIDEENELTEDSDISELMGSSADVNDAAVLEFDFVASGDTLRFSYVFASEEYNEHTCSPYNDAFGFFISGPGISGDGTFENNAVNLATIPGRDVPVAINTVNRGVAGTYGSMAVCNGADINWQENSQYFVDNETNTALNTTQFDGFTSVFTVKIPVECGGTYHIKMAIADAVDGKNDSAVFIKSGSFASKAPLAVEYDLANPVDGEALEGCSEYQLRLVRNDSTSIKVVYVKSDFASTNPGVFPNFPDSLIFYPAQGYINWNIPIGYNESFEGERILDIEFLQPQVCGLDTAISSVALPFSDTPPMSVVYDDLLLVSCDETGEVAVEVTGGLEPYEIDWEGDFSGFAFEIDGQSPLTIEGIVTDYCDLNQQSISISYEPIEYENLTISAPESMLINCLDPISISPLISGGRGDYAYQWLFNGSVFSQSSVLDFPSPEPGSFTLIVEDGCAPSDSSHVELSLMDNPVSANIGEDTPGVCNQELTIVPQVEGGFGEVSFHWKRNFAFQSSAPNFSFYPFTSSIITLEVVDECGQVAFDTMNVVVSNASINIDLPADTSLCEGERLHLSPMVYGGVGELDYLWLESGSEALTLSVIPRRNETYTLSVTDECMQTAEAELRVELIEVTADFAFDYESQSGSLINLSTINLNYFWLLPGGRSSTEFEPDFLAEVGEEQMVSLEVTHPLGCTDSKAQFFDPPLNVFVPNAFSPDGDGINDLFKAEGTFINEFDLWVFDRWGNVVFYTSNPDEGWDGTASNGDFASSNMVYSFRVVAKGFNSQAIDKVGSITVVR